MNTDELSQSEIIFLIKDLVFSQSYSNFKDSILQIPKKEIYHQIFTSKFIFILENLFDFYSNKFDSFFKEIFPILYCDYCLNGKNINFCFEYHTDLEQVESLMETLINFLNELYIKETEFNSIFNFNFSFKNTEQFSKILREKYHLITQSTLIYVKVKLEKFKENFLITQENILKQELREKIKFIGLLDLFECVFLDLIKCEVKLKIENLEFAYDKMILEDLIKYF